jgi:hypothetical protein
MNIVLPSKRERGLTLLDIFVVLAVISILAIMLIPALHRSKIRAKRIYCTNNLKQMGVACRIWIGDGDKYTMSTAGKNGGTIEFITGPNAWRHFQAMSNELSTPMILICPAESDPMRSVATNFIFLNNSNLSYFVGVDAAETNPELILFGDRNVTNGTPVRNGLLEVTSNTPAAWNSEMHDGVGNLALADGNVQQLNISGLRTSITNTGFPSNRLQMPILTP